MVKPYLAVLNAYWSSWTMRIMGVSALIMLALVPVLPVIPIVITLSLFVFSFFGLTKEQFANPRARLVPGFNKHHLAVAGATLGGLWFLSTVAVNCATASRFMGTASVLASFYALIALGTCLRPFVILVLVGLTYAFCCTARGLEQLTALIYGQAPLLSGTLLVAGVGSLMFVGWRLSRLTEEQPEYASRFTGSYSSGDLTTSQRDLISRTWSVLIQGRRLEALLSQPVTGTWGGARRLRVASGFPSTALIAAAVLGGAWIVMGILDPKGIPFPQMAFVGLLGVLVNWRFSARRLSQEAVRPVERGELMRQFGLLLLKDAFVFWFTVAAMSAAAWALLSPGTLVDLRMWHGMVIALCGLPLFVGVAGFVLRVRSDLGFWTAGMLMYMVSLITIVATISQRPSLSVTPWLSAGLLIAGVCACFGAYRVWLAGDLD